jgi:Transglycosylase-like domain
VRIPQMMLVPTRAVVAATVATLAALLLAPAYAHAVDGAPGQSVSSLRAQADAIATRYFDALAQYQTLQREIDENRATVRDLTARAKRVRAAARARAISVYRESTTRLSTVIASNDALTAARRAQFIDQVNHRDNAVFDKLRTTTRKLAKSRHALETQRAQQTDALAELRNEGNAMDAKLALAQQQELVQTQLTAQLAVAAASPPAPATAVAPATPDATVATTAPPATTAKAVTTTTTLAPAVTPVIPPYSGTPGVNPHHDDPFLTCVRGRESGGNYAAVNPAGPYLGAYQFLQSTWNATANHMGRSNLVGVPPNIATQYDQDDVAWALYQWQGMAPWGGSCP